MDTVTSNFSKELVLHPEMSLLLIDVTLPNNDNNDSLTLKPRSPKILYLFEFLLRQGKLWPILHIF